MWERELDLIKSLGKLYPELKYGIKYKTWQRNNSDKARWVHWLCTGHLNQRIPRLEEFIKENCGDVWICYKKDFNIKDE